MPLIYLIEAVDQNQTMTTLQLYSMRCAMYRYLSPLLFLFKILNQEEELYLLRNKDSGACTNYNNGTSKVGFFYASYNQLAH